MKRNFVANEDSGKGELGIVSPVADDGVIPVEFRQKMLREIFHSAFHDQSGYADAAVFYQKRQPMQNGELLRFGNQLAVQSGRNDRSADAVITSDFPLCGLRDESGAEWFPCIF